ncbi:MAG: FAD-dependent oxidoreductase [Pseudomonadota bacterium]
MKVIVVGGGIVGLSTAYALTKGGVDVTLVERGPIPHPLASSSDHHRIIRSTYSSQEGYTVRMADAHAAWQRLWDDLGAPLDRYYAKTGILTLCEDDGDFGDTSRTTMDGLGLPYELLEGAGAVEERYPFLNATGIRFGLVTDGGALMANTILTDLAAWLRLNGATVLEHAPVEAVDGRTGTVTLGDGRVLSADTVVVAAGPHTVRLMPDLTQSLTVVRTHVVYADPPDHLRQSWAGGPCWTHLGGSVHLWGIAPVAGLPLKLGNGDLAKPDEDLTHRPISPEEVDALMASFSRRLRDIDAYKVRWGLTNHWTMAPDDAFLLTRRDRAVIVSACSGHGFKFGALTGQDVADALTERANFDTVAQKVAGQISAIRPAALEAQA